MDPVLVKAAMQRVNATVVEQARGAGGRLVLVCECGHCGGELVQGTLRRYDEIRIQHGLILAPDHRPNRSLDAA